MTLDEARIKSEEAKVALAKAQRNYDVADNAVDEAKYQRILARARLILAVEADNVALEAFYGVQDAINRGEADTVGQTEPSLGRETADRMRGEG